MAWRPAVRFGGCVVLWLVLYAGESRAEGLFPDMDQFVRWIWDALLYVPKWIWSHLLEILGDALGGAFLLGCCSALISVPTVVTGLVGAVSASAVGFFLAPFQIAYGLGMICCAYGVRFLIRRLPFIG